MADLKKILKLTRYAGGLKRIRRTGWVRIGIQNPESVADHVFRTAFLSMILTRDKKINHRKLFEMIMIHDLGETATSDIRYEEGREVLASSEAKNKLEEDILKRILAPVDKDNYYLNLWYEFRDQISEEARLLKQIEKIEMALQAVEYQEMGTKSYLLDEFIENADKYVKDKDLRKLLAEIKKERKKINY